VKSKLYVVSGVSDVCHDQGNFPGIITDSDDNPTHGAIRVFSSNIVFVCASRTARVTLNIALL